jgi:hypothetical protein
MLLERCLCAENYDLASRHARTLRRALYLMESAQRNTSGLTQAGGRQSSDREAGRANCLLISALEEFLWLRNYGQGRVKSHIISRATHAVRNRHCNMARKTLTPPQQTPVSGPHTGVQNSAAGVLLSTARREFSYL